MNLIEYPKVGEKIYGLTSGVWTIEKVYIGDKIIRIRHEASNNTDMITFGQIFFYKTHDWFNWYKAPDA